MGRKAFFTEQQVFEAADSLVAEGRDVTATALLSNLGGGSLTTIYKHLAAWQAARPAATMLQASSDIPDAVQTAFLAAWRVAAAEAARELQAAREKAAEDVKAAQKQFQEALQAIERLEAESEADASRIEGLTTRVGDLEATVHKTDTDNAALKAAAEQLRHQVKSQEAELERVHKDGDAERKRHDHEVTKLKAEQAGELQKARTETDHLQAELSAAQKLTDQAERERAQLQSKLEQGGQQMAEMSKRLQTAEQKLDAANADREAAVKEASQLKGQVQALQDQNKQLLSRLSGHPGSPKKDK